MSGLIDAVAEALLAADRQAPNYDHQARAAVLATADWIESVSDLGLGARSGLVAALRAEAPPPPPTAEDVIRGLCPVCRHWTEPCEVCKATAAALRDAGLLREDTP